MTSAAAGAAVAALRAFARARPVAEACEMCAAPLDGSHDHLLQPGGRQVRCACAVCARLLGAGSPARWRRVPARVERLGDLRVDEAAWRALGAPVDLVFFVREASGRVRACYPGPGGIAESAVTPAAWQPLAAAIPALAALAPEVEALLVSRLGGRRDHYLVSIDHAYALAGLLRRHWRGLAGGPELPARVGRFFADLEAAARPA